MNFLPKLRVAVIAVIIAAVGVLSGSPSHAQTSATITLLHGIPDVPVDVVVDGSVVFTDFKYSETKSLSAYAGQTLAKVEIRAAGTTTVLYGPSDVPVPATGNYTVIAHFAADGSPALTAFEHDLSKTASGQGRIRVAHAAAAPAVDVVVGTERPIKGLVNGKSEVLPVQAGPVSGAKIAPTGGDPIADVPAVTVTAGTELTVYAVGSVATNTLTFLAEPPLTVGEEGADSTTSSTTSTTLETSTTAPASTTSTSIATKLPPTGNRETTWLMGFVFLALGSALLAVSRRRTGDQA